MIEQSFFKHDGLVQGKNIDFSTKNKEEENYEDKDKLTGGEDDDSRLPNFSPNSKINSPSPDFNTINMTQITNKLTDEEKINKLPCSSIIKPYEFPLYLSFIIPYLYNKEKIYFFILLFLFTIFLLNIFILKLLHQPNLVDVLIMGKFIFIGNILVYNSFMTLSDELSQEMKILLRIVNAISINFGFVSTVSTYNVYHKLDMIKSIKVIQKNKIIGIVFETVSVFCLNVAFTTFILFSRGTEIIPGLGLYAGVAFLYLLDILYIIFTTFSGYMIRDLKINWSGAIPHLVFKAFFIGLVGFIYFFFKGELVKYGKLSIIFLYVGFGFGVINILWMFVYYFQLNK